MFGADTSMCCYQVERQAADRTDSRVLWRENCTLLCLPRVRSAPSSAAACLLSSALLHTTLSHRSLELANAPALTMSFTLALALACTACRGTDGAPGCFGQILHHNAVDPCAVRLHAVRDANLQPLQVRYAHMLILRKPASPWSAAARSERAALNRLSVLTRCCMSFQGAWTTRGCRCTAASSPSGRSLSARGGSSSKSATSTSGTPSLSRRRRRTGASLSKASTPTSSSRFPCTCDPRARFPRC